MSRLVKILFLSLSIVALYGVDKDTPFKPGPASSFADKLTVDKLTIAVEPYMSDDKTREAFGKLNPYEYGILPVLVVMQNDGDKPLRLDRMKVEYAYRGERIEATPAADVPFTRAPKRPNVANPLPFPRRVGKNPLQKFEIEARAFAAKMLLPGQSASGFFYFQTGHRSGSSLYLAGIYEAATNKELFFFEVPFSR